MSRPLVITTAFSYGPADLWPLLHSLEQHAPTAEVLVLTSNDDLRGLTPLLEVFPRVSLETMAHPPHVIRGRFALPRKLASRTKRWLRRRQQGLVHQPAIAIEQARRFGLSTTHAHFLIRRFFWAQQCLEQERWHDHDAVMLCDVRDVVVQADPFVDLGNKLTTGEEFGLFDHCAMNRRWIRTAYGCDEERRLHGQPALCAGVVIGSRQQMQLYLNMFCRDVLDIMGRHRTSCLSNLDQAIHNKILRNPSGLQLAISPVNGPIATVGCVPAEAIAVPNAAGPVTVMGRKPTVLHQYDRRPALVQHIHAMHGHGCGNGAVP